MKIHEEDIRRLDSLDLNELMSLHGFGVKRKDKKGYSYVCPFHKDTSPSFRIQRKTEDGKQWFTCHGCGTKGVGAIELEAKLSGLNRKDDFLQICKNLAKMFCITLNGEDFNGFFHRAKEIKEPCDEIVYTRKKSGFSDYELRVLGCRIEERMERDSDGWRSTGVKHYSWSNGCSFDSLNLEKTFNLYSVESYKTPTIWDDKEHRLKNFEVVSTPHYPIFEFRYGDSQRWWSRKYEPLCKADSNGVNYKFTWWFSGNNKNGLDLGEMMYGDADFMEAYANNEVTVYDKSRPISNVENKTKFKRLVLCSGPRDAINTYYMSDVHVCWPHSESVRISSDIVKRLSKIADELYVMYDIDATGKKRSTEIGLKHLQFKVINLPEDLQDIYNPRTGKGCKDASDYFYYYGSTLKDENIRQHFEGLLLTAKSFKFWKERASRQNTGEGSRVAVTKYEIQNKNMHVFLPALGMHRYKDSKGMAKFITLRDNKVRIIRNDSGEVELTAIELMKNYLYKHWSYYNEDLEESISSSTKISTKTLGQLPAIKLDFTSFGEDFDYFFYKNCAVRITADGWEEQKYSDLPFAVNEDSILDANWRDSEERLFDIVYNQEYVENLTRLHHEKLQKLTNQDEINIEKDLFKRQLTLFRYKLRLNKRWEEMPPMIQYLWHTCRFFWEQEERGVEMTEIQLQFCHIHFINKIGALGYLLSRYRTSRRQYMVEMTDYHIINGKRNGRNGKSTVGKVLLPLVRKGQEIVGQTFKSRNETIGINFNGYVQTRDSYIYIDDLNTKIPVSTFINLLERITIKTLYENEETVSAEESPKMIISHNVHFTDQDPEGTYKGRLYTMYFSDYYHEASEDGKRLLRTPETEFGDLLGGSSEKDLQQTREMLAYALSFYLKENKERGEAVRIEAPIESHDEMEKARRALHNDTLWEWATVFFMKDYNFGRPISRSSMCISYLQYRNGRVSADRYVKINKHTVSMELEAFQKDIESYCNVTFKTNKIVYNPIALFREVSGFERKPNANGTCMIRKDAWCYQYNAMDDEYDLNAPRVLQNDRCYYFFRSKNIPDCTDDIMSAPAVDPEVRG